MDNNNPTARSRALSHADAVVAFEDQLEAELERIKPDHTVVKALNARIGVGLKLAHIYATLAVADATAAPPRLLPMGGVDYSVVEEPPC